MTSPHPTDDLPEPTASPEDQCWRYLLGELDARQSAQFEQRLGASPELGELLLRQAELVSGLSAIQLQPQLVAAPSSSTFPWKIAVSIMAIAASLAIVVLGVRSRSRDEKSLVEHTQTSSPPAVPAQGSQVSEDLLIARAWADSRRSEVSDDFVYSDLDLVEEMLPAVEPSDFDTTLSWMYIAVLASGELDDVSEGAANDG